MGSDEVARSCQRPRHGGNRLWAAQVGRCSPDQILDFSASLNPLGPPATVLQALQTAILSTPPLAITTYPDPGMTRLRQVLGQIHGVDPDWILVGNGAAELLTWAAREGSALQAVALLEPAFSDYHRALGGAGVPISPIPLPCQLGPPFPSLPELLRPWLRRAPRPRGLWLNLPHNPTGQIWPLHQVLDCLPQFDQVMVDEAFMDFLPQPQGEIDPQAPASLLPWVREFPQLMVIRSLTKLFTVPGLRMGFGVAHPERLQRWSRWRDPWSVNGLAEVAALAALQDREFQQRTQAWLSPARQHLFQGLDRLPGVIPWPGVANFLLVQFPLSVPWLQQALLRRHQILVRDCLSFQGLGERFCRIGVRTLEDQERLLAACESILAEGGGAEAGCDQNYAS